MPHSPSVTPRLTPSTAADRLLGLGLTVLVVGWLVSPAVLVRGLFGTTWLAAGVAVTLPWGLLAAGLPFIESRAPRAKAPRLARPGPWVLLLGAGLAAAAVAVLGAQSVPMAVGVALVGTTASLVAVFGVAAGFEWVMSGQDEPRTLPDGRRHDD